MSKLRKLIMGQGPTSTDLGEVRAWLDKGKVYDEALHQFTKKKLESIIKMEYEAELLGQQMKDIKEYEKDIKMTLKENIAKEHNNGYCFITINPSPEVSLTQLEEKVKKFVNRNMFEKYRYVFEQRSPTEENMGHGFHAHILLKRNLNYKPSKISLNTKNSFKGITKVDNPQILNIQHIGEEFAKDKDEYMNGVKTGEGKEAKQAIDKIFRKKNNLESVYGDNFF